MFSHDFLQNFTTKSNNSTGLALYIAKSIIEAHRDNKFGLKIIMMRARVLHFHFVTSRLKSRH
ncbi:MAG TPA: hypothetical protein VFT71_00510 [Candidatus Nitrosocosmicus sp.]|nr:hypothetical protein [Candidatus Nitrosocosmicus sp.]